MTLLDTRPQVVDIDHYAGDTLTIHVKITDVLIAGRVFTAQVRSSRSAVRADAEFRVYLRPGYGADVVLESAPCQELAKRSDYTGFWDVQLAMPDGGDPVTTLAHGELRLHSDVTRAAS